MDENKKLAIAIKEIITGISHKIGEESEEIQEIISQEKNEYPFLSFGKREMRIVRYCLENQLINLSSINNGTGQL